MVPRQNDGEQVAWISKPPGVGCSSVAGRRAAHAVSGDTHGGTLDGSKPFGCSGETAPAARRLIELYLPLCGDCPERFVVAHLGQSLDGRIATVDGSSRWVTGPEDVAHNHRMRALFDAVVVGAETVRQDDPQLTVRLVPGRNPTRVVLDPGRRLKAELPTVHRRRRADAGAVRGRAGRPQAAPRPGGGGRRRRRGWTPASRRGAGSASPGAGCGACSSKAAASRCRASSLPAACTACRSRSRR